MASIGLRVNHMCITLVVIVDYNNTLLNGGKNGRI